MSYFYGKRLNLFYNIIIIVKSESLKCLNPRPRLLWYAKMDKLKKN